MAAYKKLKVNHTDIKIAFLHGDVAVEVFLIQSEGYVIPGEENKICSRNKAGRLNMSHYRRVTEINRTLSKELLSRAIFVRSEGKNKAYSTAYVDDLLILIKDEQIKK